MLQRGEMVYVGMGSNLGDRAAAIERAVAMLGEVEGVSVRARSALHETEPVGGPPGQPRFLNGALSLACRLEPRELLDALHRIERLMGRDPAGERWGPRSIDLDILLFGDRVVDEPDLVIPHPAMGDRRFVLEPLCEIAANLVHPVHGRTMAQLLAAAGCKAVG